ncbi:DUF1161 domain-containing protein [Dyella silvatica]|uniref:DUF1161 domain-containing protein n=1 Tax=Dyella silvatica TaxID=2992128 RepID=UPI002250957D|nr:DUF1161 domain-containing protein [Dyella silvatica]
MNKRFGWAVLLVLASPLAAHASCADVSASIDAKIKANGVSGYTLNVVPADQADAAGKVVGQCEGDKKIVYARGAAGAGDSSSAAAAPPAHKRHAKKDADDAKAAEPAAASSSGH